MRFEKRKGALCWRASPERPCRHAQVEKFRRYINLATILGTALSFRRSFVRLRTESGLAKEQSGIDYYRACAAEMMTKAQAAPSKAVRQAYLNLVLNWVGEALFMQKLEDDRGEGAALPDPNHRPAPPGSPEKH